MNRRFLTPFLFLAVMLLILLACNVTTPTGPEPAAQTDTPGGGTSGPGTVTDTPSEVLPPPVVASLRVSYIKGGNVWLWTEGGAIAALTSSGNATRPLLSSDGTEVAFVRNGELWAVNADGSSERQLVSTAYLAAYAQTPGNAVEVNNIAWLPGTHTIYFNTLEVAAVVGYRIPAIDLHRVDADSPGPIQLETPGSGGVPTISPDGTMIALAQPNQIILYSVDGSVYQVVLAFTTVYTYSEWSYIPEIVWLPDSTAMRMVAPAPDPLGDPTQLSTLWNIPVVGTASALTTFLAEPVFAAFPYISPDGNNVLYLSKQPTDVSIHSIRSDGTDTYYFWYTHGEVRLRGWTPDSIHFMIEKSGDNYVSYEATGEDRKIADTPIVSDVTWVDGSRFLFLNGDELRLTTLDQPSVAIDSGVSEYGFGVWTH